ncbi:probable LRR receptor-like serine/threonine-protein kinase At5g63710 [Arachis duranensis]|uniref:Probable LRR receptor-like serine/threonine-protein kinase At5g63710 n=1 Tax=Arachis duranensis TaxID=130453 RepID=A0A9C6WF20_ARADU|nr:probable LRR receptor-like serine/threonine-protein kinase At5g63710 [Arachis duranensis]
MTLVFSIDILSFLNLASKGFSGTLSPSIAKLKYLVSLELQDNNLAGPLPDYIANLTIIEYLILADNNFSGSVPATWGRLVDLFVRDLTALFMHLFSVMNCFEFACDL